MSFRIFYKNIAHNALWLAEVGDLVSPNIQLITDHKSTKQCVKSTPNPQFLQTAVSKSPIFLIIYFLIYENKKHFTYNRWHFISRLFNCKSQYKPTNNY